VLVLAIETSTPQASVAIGSQQGTHAAILVTRSRGGDEVVVPAIQQVLSLAEVDARRVSGIAIGVGPGLFTGMRVGIATGRAMAQALSIPVLGFGSLDVLAYGVRYSRRMIVAAIDARRSEVFYAFYRPVQSGVTREGEYAVASAEALAAEIEALPEEVLLVGNGALVYRRVLEELGGQVEFASPRHAFPEAAALAELAVPRFVREEAGRPSDVVPCYVRKSDAEIAWDRRARSG
jgi:tRNA threonylcarbamoyladenosine biosynthesis protein TsaB